MVCVHVPLMIYVTDNRMQRVKYRNDRISCKPVDHDITQDDHHTREQQIHHPFVQRCFKHMQRKGRFVQPNQRKHQSSHRLTPNHLHKHIPRFQHTIPQHQGTHMQSTRHIPHQHKNNRLIKFQGVYRIQRTPKQHQQCTGLTVVECFIGQKGYEWLKYIYAYMLQRKAVGDVRQYKSKKAPRDQQPPGYMTGGVGSETGRDNHDDGQKYRTNHVKMQDTCIWIVLNKPKN